MANYGDDYDFSNWFDDSYGSDYIPSTNQVDYTPTNYDSGTASSHYSGIGSEDTGMGGALSNLWDTATNKISNMSMQDILGLGSALASTYKNVQAANAANKVNQQAQNYSNLLNESYTNPTAVYNKYYSGLDKLFYNKLLANAAAQGRSTDLYSIGQQRENNFQNFLNQYRSGLSGSMGTVPTQSYAAQNASTADPYGTMFNYLSRMFGK